MNKSITVFDFDKTLTDKDTLFGYYRCVAGGDRLFLMKRSLLLVAGILYKSGIIQNNTRKRFGISLFLKGKSRFEIEKAAQQYAGKIELNSIYHKHFLKAEGEKWVISASPEIYLRHLFPGEQVAGTTFVFSGDKVKGLDVNMFGPEKKKYLNEKGISLISEFYTDSLTDKPVMDIAQKVFIVKDGDIITCKDKNE
jgi:phosphatidylglycerophosphatase C